MTDINWPRAIGGLIATGMTQPQIAQACECGQSTISDMLNGKTTDPRTSLGLRLLSLCERHGIMTTLARPPRSTWTHASIRCTTRPSTDGRMGVAFNVPGQPVVRLSITLADAQFLLKGLHDAFDHSSCAAGTQSPMSAPSEA